MNPFTRSPTALISNSVHYTVVKTFSRKAPGWSGDKWVLGAGWVPHGGRWGCGRLHWPGGRGELRSPNFFLSLLVNDGTRVKLSILTAVKVVAAARDRCDDSARGLTVTEPVWTRPRIQHSKGYSATTMLGDDNETMILNGWQVHGKKKSLLKKKTTGFIFFLVETISSLKLMDGMYQECRDFFLSFSPNCNINSLQRFGTASTDIVFNIH